MTKRALLINIQNNAVDIGDCDAIRTGLERQDFETERKSIDDLDSMGEDLKNFPIEEYDMIGFLPSYSGLINSRKTRKSTFLNVVERSKDGALALFVCDTTLPLDPNLWNQKEGHKTKVNVYAQKPMKVIGSFTDSILSDEKAMNRVNSIWMKKLHPESSFLPLEWLSFHIDETESRMKENLQKASENLDEIYPDGVPDVHNFYYGMKKKKVAKRLLELGIGQNEKDAVFGNISEFLPDVRSLDTGSSKKRGPEYWAPLAQNCEGLYIPYDPVKGDYQFTLRFLESAYLNPDGLIVDPLINDEIAAFTDPEVWVSKAEEVSKELSELF